MTSNAAQEMVKAVSLDLSELGATGLQTSGGRVHEEFLTQLMGELGRKVYREMSENDAIVGAMLYALEMLIRPVTWTVEAGGEDAEALRSAEYLETILDDMSTSWSSVLSEWMAAPVYGFAPFEIVYKRREGENRRPGLASKFDDGLIGVRKLAIRHPTTLDRWIFDEAGGVQAMVQRSMPRLQPVTIPIEKLLLFTTLQRKGSPEGTSLLRRSFIAWFRKKRVEEIESIGIERELAGIPHFEVPAQWLGANASDDDKESLATIKKIGRRLRTDDQACVVTPMIYDQGGRPLFKFKLVNSGGRRAVDTGKAKEYYSRQIAITIMADVLLLGHEAVGSFALASSKTNLFATGVGGLLDNVETTLNRHLVPRLMRLNGFSLSTMPSFRHGDIESINLAELGNYITQLANAGFPLFPTESGELERDLLRSANLPDDGVDNLAERIPEPGGDQPNPDGTFATSTGETDEGGLEGAEK